MGPVSELREEIVPELPFPRSTTAQNSPPDRILTGGVVAFNEERHIELALDSLLGQEVPPGWRWGIIWVVASGCTDHTVAIARQVAAREPIVRVVVEAERGGKARALGEILRRAEGDALVLLNSDARASPGAVRELLRTCEGMASPFAVMGRPVPSGGRRGLIPDMIRLLWTVHDEFHREVLLHGEGTHLSDELLLLSLPMAPSIPDGIINDGSFFGAWLAQHHGRRLYAPSAVVEMEPPGSLRDHLIQRRRILVGHRQIARMVGIAPTALPRYAVAHPRKTLALLQRSIGRGGHRIRHLVALALGEAVASALAGWDLLPPQRDHVRWQRITASSPHRSVPQPIWETQPTGGNLRIESPTPIRSMDAFLDLRVGTLLRVAERFGTGVPLEELDSLLPPYGPSGVDDLRRWLDTRPDLARVEGNRAFPPSTRPQRLSERGVRAERYGRAAELLVDRYLAPVLPLVRCVGITGSTAYGAPEEGDDLDLFVVTRAGALWVFLAYTYVAVRLGFRPAPGTDRPPPCFNYVLDDRRAPTEFAESRGFLFAREALTARVFRGENYYQDLLAAAPWLGSEIPRLYAQRTSGVPPTREPPAPWAVRVLNASLYPVLAAYLQLAGLRRNSRLRSERAHDAVFRTVTRPRQLAFVSHRFDQLRADLAPATFPARGEPSMAAPSRIPSAR